MQEKKEAVHLLQGMLEYRKSELYAHIDFAEKEIKNTAFLMKQCFFHDEITGFLKDEPEFEEFKRELDALAE